MKASSYLLSIYYRKHTDSPNGLVYNRRASGLDDIHQQGESAIVAPSMDISDDKLLDQLIMHAFPAGSAWIPERIEIHGRKGRRSICVVAEDRLNYRIYDLDSGSEAYDQIRSERSERSDMMS